MMTIASRWIAKVKETLLKCLVWAKWLDGTDIEQAGHVIDKGKGLVLPHSELLFVKGILESERQRIWEAKYYPLTKVLKMEDVTKEYQKVIKERPDSPEAHCFHLLDRIGRLECKETEKEKNV